MFKQSPVDFMNFCAAACLICAIATTLLTGREAHAQQGFTSQPQADLAIEKIAAEANARIEAGVPDVEVEAWMKQAMTEAGMTVKKKPESWDVYGQASWEQEVSQDEKAPKYREPEELANIGGLPTREPVDGSQQTHTETEGRGNDSLHPQASDEGLGHRVRDRSGGHAQEQGSSPTPDYVFNGRLGATGPARLEDGIHDTRVFEEGEASLPRPRSIN